MLSIPPQLQVGDIVGTYLPLFSKTGEPGDDFRLAIVLGLEVDPKTSALEGLWMIRLSPRAQKVRSWDHPLGPHDYVSTAPDLAGDMVVRTTRIDLLPVNAGYFKSELTVFGNVKPYVWDTLLHKIKEGHLCKMAEPSFGPRRKLPGTVVKAALDHDDYFFDFDVETMITAVSLPSIGDPPLIMPDDYTKALAQQHLQIKEKGHLIGRDFRAACRLNPPDYPPTLLGPMRPLQAAQPEPAPTLH